MEYQGGHGNLFSSFHSSTSQLRFFLGNKPAERTIWAVQVIVKELAAPGSTATTVLPIILPAMLPTMLPTMLPAMLPTMLPAMLPTMLPAMLPTMLPAMLPAMLLAMLPAM